MAETVPTTEIPFRLTPRQETALSEIRALLSKQDVFARQDKAIAFLQEHPNVTLPEYALWHELIDSSPSLSSLFDLPNPENPDAPGLIESFIRASFHE